MAQDQVEPLNGPRMQVCTDVHRLASRSPTHRFSQSTSDTRLNINRLSLTFPLPGLDTDRRAQPVLSASPASSRSISPSRPSIVDDSARFLTALAAQERRVLELREELKKAESDLAQLKEQWSTHEALKQRNEAVRKAVPLRPIGSQIHASPERETFFDNQPIVSLERRRSLQARSKPAQRRFEGGKHARALSLLSPNSVFNGPVEVQTTTSPLSDLKENPDTPKNKSGDRTPKHARAHESLGRREEFMSSSKQLVGDLREGLWTFIEDLKQATVGDEAMTTARARQALSTPTQGTRNSRQTSPSAQHAGGQSCGFEDAKGQTLNPAKEPVATHPEKVYSAGQSDTVDEGWDNWDSPPKTSSTSDETCRSTPRTSISSETSKVKQLSGTFDQIPWPALNKISPSRLSRTASSLMQEWENSIKEPAPAGSGTLTTT